MTRHAQETGQPESAAANGAGHDDASEVASRLRARAAWIAALYAAGATLWIYFSDQALRLLAPDPETFSQLSVFKGVGFVLVTALLLLLLMWRAFGETARAYRRLQRLNQNLEWRVAERTRELEAAVVQAESADRLKSAFLATMSHELRTPLNSIIGFTGMVLQELPGPLNDEQKKQLGMVRSSARHLLALINDVLDLSRIEADQLSVKSAAFDLPASLEHVLKMVTPVAEQKGLTLHSDMDPRLARMVSDRRRFEQIVLNLVNNAIKFTERGTVTLRAHRVDRPGEPSRLQLEVADTGIGIQEHELARLFRPFQQVDTGLSRSHEGTGLGLAICRRLATLLGGRIDARSDYGHGSTFTLTLPLELPP